MNDRNKAFFLRHGIDEDILAQARLAHRQFMHVESQHGHHFFNTPIAFKAFVMGWAWNEFMRNWPKGN